ncbi:MAG: hypothetical protein HYT94_05420 [Parcubacteria group bacterium]|nr:hypothetical protein [Parcubacteria group bacterium]
MDVIKEHRQETEEQRAARCVVRTNCYGSQLSFFLELFEEAKKDFPTLTPEDVRVIHFGGQFYSGTFGIEFTPPETVPAIYQTIRELELSR